MIVAIMFQGSPFLKVAGSLGSHFITLDPSLLVKLVKPERVKDVGLIIWWLQLLINNRVQSG